MTGSRSTFTLRDAALLGLLALLWGNSFLFIKLAVDSIDPAWIVAGRLAVGGLLLVGIVIARNRTAGGVAALIPRERDVLIALAVTGTVGAGLPWLAQAWAQQFLDSGLVAVLNATTPVATLAVAVLVGQERLHRERVLGLAIAIIGTVVIIGGEVRAGGPAMPLLTAVLATIGYAVGSVVTRAKVSGRHRPLPSAAVQLVFGAVVLNVVALIAEGLPPAPWVLEPLAAGAVLALGVLGTGVAFIIYFTLIERVGATNASMVTYIVPVVGLVAGALVRGERFGPNVLLGAAVLILGVWLAQRTTRPQVVADAPAPATVSDRG